MKANDQPVQAWKVKCYILSCRNIHRTVRKQNVHKLHNMCHVKEKEQWIKTGITPSNQSCSYPQDDMTKYANLIFDDPDKKSVLNHNCYILMLDLATIAQRGWISHAILNRVTDTLQINTEHTFVCSSWMFDEWKWWPTEEHFRKIVKINRMNCFCNEYWKANIQPSIYQLAKWQEFLDSFECHGLSDMDKFSYLRTLLPELARSTIRG